MSYHVTILRTKNGKQDAISSSEVEDAVAAMDELKMKPRTHGRFEISPSMHGGQDTLLIWQDGEIWTKNPDDKTIQMMLNLAKRLGARVRGDEFETYKTPHESYQHPDDLASIQSSRQTSQKIVRTAKRQQRLLIGVIFGIFILLAFLVSYFV